MWVAHHDIGRLRRELDTLAAAGMKVIRITALSEGSADAPLQAVPSLQPEPGVYDSKMAVALDVVMAELATRRIRAMLVLNNMWSWSGGFSTYLMWASRHDANGGNGGNGGNSGSGKGKTTWREIPYPSSHLDGYWDARPPSERPHHTSADWHEYQVYASKFYTNPRAVALAEGSMRWLLTRRNSITGLLYSDDPTVFAWELCNEPRAVTSDPAERPALRASYLRWVTRSSSLIKSLAPKQLVAVGSEGITPFAEYVNQDFLATHAITDVDLITIHIWPQNWEWGDASSQAKYEAGKNKALTYLSEHAQHAKTLGKPLLLEEFGLARDMQSLDPEASAHRRDAFYTAMLAAASKLPNVAGVMPWAWGGEGRHPASAASSTRTSAAADPRYWREKDDVMGDPPHESQGWYSVLDSDASTLGVLRRGFNAQRLPPSPPWPPVPPTPPPSGPLPAPPPACYSTQADDSPYATCEPWCALSAHCSMCKCQRCPRLHCAKSCRPYETDDADVEKCESWCDPSVADHLKWCKCKGCE